MAENEPYCQRCMSSPVVVTDVRIEQQTVAMPQGIPPKQIPWIAVSYHCTRCHNEGVNDIKNDFDARPWTPKVCPYDGVTSPYSDPAPETTEPAG
jgi:hypothetical protein